MHGSLSFVTQDSCLTKKLLIVWNKRTNNNPDDTTAYGFKASMFGHQNNLYEAKKYLSKYLEMRSYIKNINDYKKVVPTVIKDVLVKGLIKAGMTND